MLGTALAASVARRSRPGRPRCSAVAVVPPKLLWARRALDRPVAGRHARPAGRCCGQLLVDLVVERRAQRRVGGEVGHDQRDDGDRPDREQESEPQ